jgi:hypothetical protein
VNRKIILTESQLIGVIKKIITEQSEHVKNLYKSWANKRSGNPEKALSIIDDVLKLQKQLPKKDFAQYSSYDELVKDLDKVKQAAKSEDVTKIYEDKDLLVLAANTWEASCKYGAGSKWCTTSRDTDSYWDRHNKTGTEFFWIFKNKPQKDPNHKFSYHIKDSADVPDWCNAINKCTKDIPSNSYPKQHPKYKEIINKLQELHNSRDFEVYKSKFDVNKEIIDEALMIYVDKFIKNNISYFLKVLKNSFDDELKYELSWHGGVRLLMKVLKVSHISYVKGANDIINNKVKDFIENKFKNEDLFKYFNFENIKERTTEGLRYVVFRVLREKGIDGVQNLILPQLEEIGLTIEDVVSGLPDKEFKESIVENIEYTNSGFTELLKKEMFKVVEDNINEFKKLVK